MTVDLYLKAVCCCELSVPACMFRLSVPSTKPSNCTSSFAESTWHISRMFYVVNSQDALDSEYFQRIFDHIWIHIHWYRFLSIVINCPKVTSQVWLLPSLAIIGLHQCAFTGAIDSILQTCLHKRQMALSWPFDELMDYCESKDILQRPYSLPLCPWLVHKYIHSHKCEYRWHLPRARAHVHPRLAAARWPASKQSKMKACLMITQILQFDIHPTSWSCLTISHYTFATVLLSIPFP